MPFAFPSNLSLRCVGLMYFVANKQFLGGIVMNRHFYVLVALVVSACTAAPTVEYNKIMKPDDLKGDEIDSFYLQRSIIKIDRVGTKKTAEGTEVDDVNATSIPAEFTDFKIGIRRADSFGVKTNLNVTKRPNTDLVSEAGVEVVDTRVDTITKIGSIVTKVVPVAFDAQKGLEPSALPKLIQTQVLLKDLGRASKDGVDASDGVTIDFGPVPPDAKGIDKLPSNFVTTGMIYSACRQATVSFKYKGNNYKQAMKVADPNFYERVAFPVKGKILFHSECGVSVTSEKDTGVSSNAAVIDALATQGKAIKEAIDAAKKDDAGKGK